VYWILGIESDGAYSPYSPYSRDSAATHELTSIFSSHFLPPIHISIHTYTHTHIHRYTHIHIYTHTLTYTHTHTQRRVLHALRVDHLLQPRSSAPRHGPGRCITIIDTLILHIHTNDAYIIIPQYASAFHYFSTAINLQPTYARAYTYLALSLAK
jgi:hypothetical protein